MPKVCYVSKTFGSDAEKVIRTANSILEDYTAQGYDLTLRQLYYQFVARGYIANKDSEYKRLGSIINDARLAGRIDWSYITDRTRNLQSNPHWGSPRDIVRDCAEQFQHDKWGSQEYYVECWVEKDALVGVLEAACGPLDVPYFSCRGYTSQSEMWAAAMRLLSKVRAGKKIRVIHLGDHDPSGIDMTRDIEDRVRLFINHHMMSDYLEAHPPPDDGVLRNKYIEKAAAAINVSVPYDVDFVHRIALNMDQVEDYSPPPNPAKITDSRAGKYIQEYGEESWELDALEPAVLADLIRGAVEEIRDQKAWDKAVELEAAARKQLRQCAAGWHWDGPASRVKAP